MVVKSEYVSGYYVQQRPWTPTKRRGPISSDFKTPGPGAFTIPSTIGDRASTNVTKGQKAPSFTFGTKPEEKRDLFVPGPGTYNIAGLSEKGKDTVSAPTMAPKLREPEGFKTPAPGAYNPEKAEQCVLSASPMYTFGSKIRDPKPADIPAPGTYCPEKSDTVLATTPAYTFGIKHKDLRPDDVPAPGAYCPERADTVLAVTPAYTFGTKPKDAKPDDFPAPGKYNVPGTDTYKNKSPAYTLSYRTNIPSDHTKKPGPGAHSPERVWMNKSSSPRFTFGIRHSPVAETPKPK